MATLGGDASYRKWERYETLDFRIHSVKEPKYVYVVLSIQ